MNEPEPEHFKVGDVVDANAFAASYYTHNSPHGDDTVRREMRRGVVVGVEGNAVKVQSQDGRLLYFRPHTLTHAFIIIEEEG